AIWASSAGNATMAGRIPSMAYSATAALVRRWALPSTDSSALASPSSVDMRAFHGRGHGLTHSRCDGVLGRDCPTSTPPTEWDAFTGVAELLRFKHLP